MSIRRASFASYPWVSKHALLNQIVDFHFAENFCPETRGALLLLPSTAVNAFPHMAHASYTSALLYVRPLSPRRQHTVLLVCAALTILLADLYLDLAIVATAAVLCVRILCALAKQLTLVSFSIRSAQFPSQWPTLLTPLLPSVVPAPLIAPFALEVLAGLP